MSDHYYDTEGNEASLDQLCKLEPEWAANRIREYERREKLYMDRCRHDMERIVRLEQQLADITGKHDSLSSKLEKCEAERERYARWFYEKFGQAFESEEDLDALLEANRGLQAKLDRYRTALKSTEDHPWQPIDTAPKDGTPILGFIPSYYQGKGGMVVAVWMDFSDRPGWYSEISSVHEPTHWMPLPPAPTGNGAEG